MLPIPRECPLDLHQRVFAVGGCAQTLIGKSNVLIVREDLQRFAICVRRSFAEYLYALLRHSADLVARARN
jgi:sarcosine oxidase subunit gamma